MTTFQKFSNVDYPCVKSRCYEDLRPKKKVEVQLGAIS